jgi:tetratricopeptide (TPR) repeat protein
VAFFLALGPAGELLGQPRTSDDLISYYQARLARRTDVRSYARLGQAYILKARETGDLTYYTLADTALSRCLELGPDRATAARAATDLAAIQMARHQFREALATGQKALGLDAGSLLPYGPIGDAHIELGEYDKAEAAYERMKGLTGPFYPHGRLSMLKFLKGDAAGALVEMRRAVETGIEGSQPKENVAWAQFKVGATLFQTGALTGAAQAHQEALSTFPGYHRALAGLGQVRAAEGRYVEAIELYRKAIGIIPLPDYAASLGDVYAKTGRSDEARKQYALVEYIGRLNALNQVLYNRELALFYLNHDLKLGEALDLARKELEVRRDLYTSDVLAWALYKNGRARDALAPMMAALRLGTKDARLLYHAGMIYQAVGDREPARRALQEALRLSPHFDLLQVEVAERALKEIEARPGQP